MIIERLGNSSAKNKYYLKQQQNKQLVKVGALPRLNLYRQINLCKGRHIVEHFTKETNKKEKRKQKQ